MGDDFFGGVVDHSIVCSVVIVDLMVFAGNRGLK